MQPNQPQGPQPPKQAPTEPFFTPPPSPELQHPAEYDFIMNPQKASTGGTLPSLSTGSSSWRRAAIVAGGFVLLIIIGVILKSALTSHPDMTTFVGIAQEQQELIHLTDSASQEKTLSTANKNFALTTKLSLATAQQNTLSYIQTNHHKVKDKELNLLVSATTDQKLTEASTENNYNPVFQQIITSELAKYERLLKAANASAGPNGRKLTAQQFNDEQLLKQQLANGGNPFTP